MKRHFYLCAPGDTTTMDGCRPEEVCILEVMPERPATHPPAVALRSARADTPTVTASGSGSSAWPSAPRDAIVRLIDSMHDVPEE